LLLSDFGLRLWIGIRPSTFGISSLLAFPFAPRAGFGYERRVRLWRCGWFGLLLGLWPALAPAQIDPEPRRLLQFGYNQPLEGRGPIAGYAFAYLNSPDFPATNLTLRLAIAPVYLDAELGVRNWLGEHTDLGIGVAGGGFADSFAEIRQGEFLRAESFEGHSVESGLSLYHCFNPRQLIPLNLILRATAHRAFYDADDRTDPAFVVPDDRTEIFLRAGLRWGGKEPLLIPDVAMEVSLWYEGRFRMEDGPYGFNGDRTVNDISHRYWGRALLIYTLPESRHNLFLSVTAGGSDNADRFSAYRLGAALPFASEFPLFLPGFYFQEITAERFALLNAQYLVPLDRQKRWFLAAFAGTAAVDYLPGFAQDDNWLSGVGGGISYMPPNKLWQVSAGYARGLNALRDGEKGANSVGVLVQFDLERGVGRGKAIDPNTILDRFRGVEGIFRR
jgi:hypothetical protein